MGINKKQNPLTQKTTKSEMRFTTLIALVAGASALRLSQLKEGGEEMKEAKAKWDKGDKEGAMEKAKEWKAKKGGKKEAPKEEKELMKKSKKCKKAKKADDDDEEKAPKE